MAQVHRKLVQYGTGYSLWYKRLEKGRFHLPDRVGEDFRIDGRELAMMLEGVEWAAARRRKRYTLPGLL